MNIKHVFLCHLIFIGACGNDVQVEKSQTDFFEFENNYSYKEINEKLVAEDHARYKAVYALGIEHKKQREKINEKIKKAISNDSVNDELIDASAEALEKMINEDLDIENKAIEASIELLGFFSAVDNICIHSDAIFFELLKVYSDINDSLFSAQEKYISILDSDESSFVCSDVTYSEKEIEKKIRETEKNLVRFIKIRNIGNKLQKNK